MIEFLEKEHVYLADGVIIPSVSELIRFKFPGQYDGIPEKVLKNKASYGSKVHKTIEEFVSGEFTLDQLKQKKIDPDIKIAVEQFEYLRKNWAFYIQDMEQIVCYKDKYAGTYDMRTEDDVIIDLKTTAALHEEWLSWQLGLYYLAAGIERAFGYVIWLPKGKMGECRQINVMTHDECKKLLKEYEKSLSSKR